MDTEGLAVNAVESSLFTHSWLRSYIDKNDRTPLTDGHIDVHSSTPCTNKNLRGRVTVQVKGKSVDNGYKPRESETFSLERTVLQGYLHSKGVLFFLVLINKKDPSVRTVYCTLLNPFRIKHILDQLPETQASTTIRLSRFSTHRDVVESLFALAIQTQQESLSLGFDPKLFADAQEVILYSDRKVDLERPLTLNYEELNHSLILHTKTGLAFPVPGLMTIYPREYVEQPTDFIVQSGGFTFTNPTVKKVSEERHEIRLGDGLRLEAPSRESSPGGSITLSLRDSLGGRHKDIGFFLACVDNGSYSISEREYRFDATGLEPGDKLRTHFDGIDRICKLLRALNVDPELVKLSEITDKRERQLHGLFEAIIENAEFKDNLERPGRVLQPIGRWFLELILVMDESTGNWKYLSLFSLDLARQFYMVEDEDSPESKIFRITPYDIIDEERLPFTLNLNLERVVEAYAEIFDYSETSTRANHMVLKLIGAADTVEERRKEFLDAARRLNDWLIEREGELPSHMINRWQLLERRGKLNDHHRLQIRALRRAAIRSEVDQSDKVAFCCSVLLCDSEEADDLYAGLSDDDQASLRAWPIWALRRSDHQLTASR